MPKTDEDAKPKKGMSDEEFVKFMTSHPGVWGDWKKKDMKKELDDIGKAEGDLEIFLKG